MANFQKLTPRAVDYSKWYNELVVKADLAEQSAVRGCMVIKPYGYEIWERIQQALDARFKEYGVKNAYFPMLIPSPISAARQSMWRASPKSAQWLRTTA